MQYFNLKIHHAKCNLPNKIQSILLNSLYIWPFVLFITYNENDWKAIWQSVSRNLFLILFNSLYIWRFIIWQVVFGRLSFGRVTFNSFSLYQTLNNHRVKNSEGKSRIDFSWGRIHYSFINKFLKIFLGGSCFVKT